MVALFAISAAILGVACVYLLFRLRRASDKLTSMHLSVADAKAQLRYQEKRLGLLAPLKMMSQAAFNALLLVDTSHDVIHMNAAASELFEKSTHPYSGNKRSVMLVTRNHEIDDLVRTMFSEQEEDYIEQIEIRGLTYRVRAMRREEHVALCLEDVSELQRLGRARREFVANISHELRTPITSIRLLVDTVLRGTLADTTDNRNTLRKIAAETEVLHQMAQELLDLSMIESGRAEFMLRPTSLDHIVETAIQLFSERAHRKKLSITAPQDLNRVLVLADREQLRRVLSNLLHNSIKFTPREGSITVEVDTSNEEWVYIAVTDTGPGISPIDRERIFERFYRADRARHTEGTGLGLAIAKHIISAHGGAIWAEDTPNPPGARICFKVPRP